MGAAVVVVPCYNEAARLRDAELVRLARAPQTSLLLVDDGSGDDTWSRLERIRALDPDGVRCVRRPRCGGKGEAVRTGLLAALESSPEVVGYLDADLSTPVDGMLRLVEVARRGPAEVVLGSRIRFLGTDIRRHAWRHYLGRVFATGASLALDLPVYDTQCGAKAFRVTPALRAALERPFRSRWAFDVELLGRLLRGDGSVPGVPRELLLEVPLDAWEDVAGSKVRPGGMLRAAVDLVSIALEMRRGRGTEGDAGRARGGATE